MHEKNGLQNKAAGVTTEISKRVKTGAVFKYKVGKVLITNLAKFSLNA